tara:strand:- start:1423 stop:1986 length:564 start_codon:yes stop_codon:yes gene_type:complete
MKNKNGIIIHNGEAPTCVIVKGYEAVALLDAHRVVHYNACADALIALLSLDDNVPCLNFENATGWTSDTLKGYVASLADDRGYDYYSIVKFVMPTITDSITSLQAEYDVWLKANCPQSMLDDHTYEMTAENLMLHTKEWFAGEEDTNEHGLWLTDNQVDYLRAFCRRWDVAENYVSDEEYALEESSV